MGNVVRSRVSWFRLGYIAEMIGGLSNDMVKAFDVDGVSSQEKDANMYTTICNKQKRLVSPK